MFIRRTQNRSRISGEPHVTYRLVQSERVGQAVKQSTVLNLGSHFDLPPAHWPALTRRIEESVGPKSDSLLASTLRRGKWWRRMRSNLRMPAPDATTVNLLNTFQSLIPPFRCGMHIGYPQARGTAAAATPARRTLQVQP